MSLITNSNMLEQHQIELRDKKVAEFEKELSIHVSNTLVKYLGKAYDEIAPNDDNVLRWDLVKADKNEAGEFTSQQIPVTLFIHRQNDKYYARAVCQMPKNIKLDPVNLLTEHFDMVGCKWAYVKKADVYQLLSESFHFAEFDGIFGEKKQYTETSLAIMAQMVHSVGNYMAYYIAKHNMKVFK